MNEMYPYLISLAMHLWYGTIFCNKDSTNYNPWVILTRYISAVSLWRYQMRNQSHLSPLSIDQQCICLVVSWCEMTGREGGFRGNWLFIWCSVNGSISGANWWWIWWQSLDWVATITASLTDVPKVAGTRIPPGICCVFTRVSESAKLLRWSRWRRKIQPSLSCTCSIRTLDQIWSSGHKQNPHAAVRDLGFAGLSQCSFWRSCLCWTFLWNPNGCEDGGRPMRSSEGAIPVVDCGATDHAPSLPDRLWTSGAAHSENAIGSMAHSFSNHSSSNCTPFLKKGPLLVCRNKVELVFHLLVHCASQSC